MDFDINETTKGGEDDILISSSCSSMISSRFTAVFFVAFILLFIFVVPTKEYLLMVLGWIEGLGRTTLGSIVFVCVYILTTVFLVPGVILTIFAGYLYGIWWGSALSWIGSTGGALACFLGGRKVFKGFVESIASNYPILGAVNNILEQEDGFKLVVLLRLSPITPYSILNYLLSTTKINLWSYISSTMIGLIPGTFMYNYLGTVARSFPDLVNTTGSEDDPSKSVRGWIFCISLIVTIFVVVLLGFVSARAIRNELRSFEKQKLLEKLSGKSSECGKRKNGDEEEEEDEENADSDDVSSDDYVSMCSSCSSEDLSTSSTEFETSSFSLLAT